MPGGAAPGFVRPRRAFKSERSGFFSVKDASFVVRRLSATRRLLYRLKKYSRGTLNQRFKVRQGKIPCGDTHHQRFSWGWLQLG